MKITPWTEGGGCLCQFAFVVDEDAVKELARTEDTHSCCGKRLSVVEVTFVDKYKPIALVVSQQVAASGTGARGSNTRLICDDDCMATLTSCVEKANRNGTSTADCSKAFHRCMQYCANVYGNV